MKNNIVQFSNVKRDGKMKRVKKDAKTKATRRSMEPQTLLIEGMEIPNPRFGCPKLTKLEQDQIKNEFLYIAKNDNIDNALGWLYDRMFVICGCLDEEDAYPGPFAMMDGAWVKESD